MLAEKLREHETWLRKKAESVDYPFTSQEFLAEADKIRALVKYADGRVLVKPTTFLHGDLVVLVVEARNRAGVSSETHASLRQLQGFVDYEDGRVLPE